MSASMSRYLASTMGWAANHPSASNNLVPVGYDEDDDAEVLGEANELNMMGWSPARALMQARQNARQRRQARMMHRCGPYGGGGGRQMVGGEDDDFDDDSVGEDEIESLGEDDEDVGDDDEGPDVLGANAARVAKRIDRIEDRLRDAKAELRSTPQWRGAKRRRLERKINRLEAKLARKQRRLQQKADKMKRKYGAIPAGALSPEPSIGQGYQRLANFPTTGFYPGSAAAGVEQFVNVQFSNEIYTQADFAAAATAGSTAAINGESDQINYADLQITALQVAVQIQWDRPAAASATGAWVGPPNDVFILVNLSSLIVSGNVNAFYSGQVLPSAGQCLAHTRSNQTETWVYRITGLRDDAVMERNSTAQLVGSVVLVKSPEVAGSVIVTSSIVAQRLRDTVLDRRR